MDDVTDIMRALENAVRARNADEARKLARELYRAREPLLPPSPPRNMQGARNVVVLGPPWGSPEDTRIHELIGGLAVDVLDSAGDVLFDALRFAVEDAIWRSIQEEDHFNSAMVGVVPALFEGLRERDRGRVAVARWLHAGWGSLGDVHPLALDAEERLCRALAGPAHDEALSRVSGLMERCERGLAAASPLRFRAALTATKIPILARQFAEARERLESCLSMLTVTELTAPHEAHARRLLGGLELATGAIDRGVTTLEAQRASGMGAYAWHWPHLRQPATDDTVMHASGLVLRDLESFGYRGTLGALCHFGRELERAGRDGSKEVLELYDRWLRAEIPNFNDHDFTHLRDTLQMLGEDADAREVPGPLVLL
jgi:hypothetical protein